MRTKLLSDVYYRDQVAPSSECLRGKSLVRLILQPLSAACGSFFACAKNCRYSLLGLRAGTGCFVLRDSLLYVYCGRAF